MRTSADDRHRKDDLVSIRKARFVSFVLLLVCFAAMLVIFIVLSGAQAYIVTAVLIAVLIVYWWFAYKRILSEEKEFFDALDAGIGSVTRRRHILESAVRKIGDGVVILTEDGDLILVNETARRLLEVVDDDLDGINYDEYAENFSDKLVRSVILDAAKKGKPLEIIEVNEKSYRIEHALIEADREKGWPLAAVAVISDVTERKNIENMQTDFVANISHELKTPLASVRGYAETLISGAVDNEEQTNEFLGIIVSEAERMDRMIKGQLFLERAEHIGLKINTEEEDLTKIVKLSMRKLDMSAGKKALSLIQLFGDDRVSAEVDRDSIEQLVQNILSNAIKYTEEKGRVDVDIIQGQNCVQIVISDNGVGIADEDLSRVFEPYYMGDKARTGGRDGTGLGLAISKKIIEAHSGTIGIDSKLGQGTTVTVTLPAGRLRGIPGIL